MKIPAPTSASNTARITHFAYGCWRKKPARRSRNDSFWPPLCGRRSPSTGRGCLTSSSSSMVGETLTLSATLFSSQKRSGALFSHAEGARQRKLCDVVHVQRLNIGFVRGGYGFLCLHHIKASGNAGAVAVLRLL